MSDPRMIPGALKVPLTLNAANETHEQLESFRECNLFVRLKKVRGIYVVRSDHAAEHTNFNLLRLALRFSLGKVSWSSSTAPSQCSRGKGCTLYELLLHR